MRVKDNTSDLMMRGNAPKVSLIVPMYMCEDYVNDLLDNLCGQDFRDTEIICVVDGSPDRTYELVCSYAERDTRVQVYETEHKGAGAARNFGLSKARGEYLMFPDADDEYETNYVSRMLEAAERNNADIAMCHYTNESIVLGSRMKHSGYSCLLVPKDRALHPTTKNSYINYISMMPHNKIFKHSLIQANSLSFSETFSANDVLFCVTSLICACTVVFIEDHLLTYRYLKNASSISSSRGNHPEDVISVYHQLYSWLKDRNLAEAYLSDYCARFSSSCRYYATQCEGEDFARIIARELAEEEPWRKMSDRELRSSAMLYCGVAKKTLKKCKKALRSDVLLSRQKEVLTNRMKLAEREVRNYSEIIRILREEYGKNIRWTDNALTMRMAQVRQVGLLGAMQIAYRKILNRRVK